MEDQFDIADVSIEIGSQFYNTFKDIQNTPSHVFAEFVDNALQSYRDHSSRLHELEPGYRLQVNIDVEWEPGGDRARKIIISDNAGGIGGDRYKTAFMPGKRPRKNTGLNEKGMGLKTAACWLGDTWTVKTAALGESVSRTMHFDLDTVSEEELQKVPVEREVKDINEHYTWIEITNPTANCPTIRYIETIKAELSSIYRKSFRDNEMTVRAFGENLSFEEYEVLEAPFARTPDADAIYWKKDFEVSFKSFKAHGFIGLLRRMSTTHNGIVVFRRGRAILGASLEEKRYTPKCLCGNIGSPRYKRVFGEVTIEGFEVSFNKNDIQDRDSLDILMEMIRDEFHTREFDLITQGEEFREDAARKSVNTLVTKHNNTARKNKAPIELQTRPAELVAQSNTPTGATQPSAPAIQKPALLGQFDDHYTINGVNYTFKSQFVDQGDLFWVDLSHKKEGEIICRINSRHVFFESAKLNDSVVAVIRALAIAKFMAMEDGQGKATELYNHFNDIIKLIKL